MAECAHPLDVLGKILWIACFGGIIATGILFVDPINQESKHAEGACNVTTIYYTKKSCTQSDGTLIKYWCINFKGYYLKPTRYSNSAEYQWAVDNNNYTSVISMKDTWKAKYVADYIHMTHKNVTKSGRDDCYLTFGDGPQDYPCSTDADMMLILDRILTRDFPQYNITYNSSYYYSTHTEYPNQYKDDPITYQKCYYSREYGTIILYKEAVAWHIVFFFLCWMGMFIGIGLLVKFGEGAAHEFAKWIVSMAFLALYVPFYFINFFCFMVISLVAGIFCNYTMQTDMDEWIKKGGIFRPLVKFWKYIRRCNPCKEDSESDRESDVAHVPTVVEIPQAASAPDIVISNPHSTEAPPTFDLPTLIPQYDYDVEPPSMGLEWEAPPPSYDEVMK